MPWKDPNHFSWFQTLVYSLFAAFGGLMGYLMRAVDRGQPVSYGRAFLEAVGAGFVGALVTLACMAMQLDPLWSGVVVGVSGWLGAQATIRVLEILVYKKLGIAKADVDVAKEIRDDQDNPR